MKILSLLFVLLWSATTTGTASGDATSSERSVAAMETLVAARLPPDWRERLKEGKKPGDFDPNRFFAVLTHLSMEPGCSLDYVFDDKGIGARPILYTRCRDARPIHDFKAYEEALKSNPKAKEALDPFLHVRVDGTAVGFIELAILRVMGEQFYLVWHAAYNDLTPVCGRGKLQEILARMAKPGPPTPMSVEDRARAEALDVRPAVDFDDANAKVSIVAFTLWGGFSRKEYRFQRAFPHRLLKSESVPLVEYNCRIVF